MVISSRKRQNFDRGFSLTEVTLAMGIAAFGLSIVFALMPTSMENLKTSADLSVEHRIFNRIVGEIRSGPWSGVDQLNESFRFFTAQAMSLPDEKKDSLERVYTARIEVENDATGIHASNRSRRIAILVTHLPDYEAAFLDGEGRDSYRTYSALVTSLEK